MKWKLSGGLLDFESRAQVMGILNVTPDSFSDGGKHVGDPAGTREAIGAKAVPIESALSQLVRKSEGVEHAPLQVGLQHRGPRVL